MSISAETPKQSPTRSLAAGKAGDWLKDQYPLFILIGLLLLASLASDASSSSRIGMFAFNTADPAAVRTELEAHAAEVRAQLLELGAAYEIRTRETRVAAASHDIMRTSR